MMNYYSVIKGNEVSSQKKNGDFKIILLSVSSQYDMATHCTIPSKVLERTRLDDRDLGVAERNERTGRRQGIFKVVKVFYRTQGRWTHTILHQPKPRDCITLNINVSYGL